MEQLTKHSDFHHKIGDRERRKLKAKREGKPNIWQGFGVFGLVGWSIVVPTVSLVLVGMWLDEKYNTRLSFTMALLALGLVLGCLNAWYWVEKKINEFEDKDEINKD